ncbi:Mor transcription activator family protein [Burkholderia sp. RS02]|uniref:Mor transcription activator family protein n=1 Tax=unclassified Burkholderia TaxID=2613784 RepID=UPI0032182616
MNFTDVEDELPDFVRLLVRLIGMPKTVMLIEKLGGTTFPVAKRLSRQGEVRYQLLAEVVGVEAADRLTEHFGGEPLYIPTCAKAVRLARDRRIRADFDTITREHSSLYAVVKLVQRNKLSDRQIWRILKQEDPPSSRQVSLF